jgi:hypothetical protein
LLGAPLLLEIGFVQPRRRQRLDAAHHQEVLQIAAGQPVPVNLEHVGVKRELVDPDELLEIGVDREIEPASPAN